MQMIQVLCQYACSYTPRRCYNQEEGAIKASENSKIHERDDYPPIVERLCESFNDTSNVGVAILPQTISRHLAEGNLKSMRPFRALPLTLKHQQLRLQWCQARSMWNVTDWQKVVFSQESRFVLGTDDNRVRVWMRPGERCNSPRTVLRHTARTAGVIVWVAIAYDKRSTLIVMRVTLTGQRYVDGILRPHVDPFLNGFPGAIFQQDSARSQTARVAQDFLRHFQTLLWLAHFPRFVPCRTRDVSAKTADAIVSLCT
ncbi:transposable element Tcb2 transposase [Trichonephila clavipes]|nr:transposable element Tcb2 transposase [Trichonephila clavipes]